MIHPSYSDLMEVVSEGAEPGEEPIVNSRYSIVMATAKRARQIIGGHEPMAKATCDKPFSVAVEELYEGKINIIGNEEDGIINGHEGESLLGFESDPDGMREFLDDDDPVFIPFDNDTVSFLDVEDGEGEAMKEPSFTL